MNIEREAIGILHSLEKLYHYCFACEIAVMRDQEPLVVIFKKDAARLSHQLQRIILL